MTVEMTPPAVDAGNLLHTQRRLGELYRQPVLGISSKLADRSSFIALQGRNHPCGQLENDYTAATSATGLESTVRSGRILRRVGCGDTEGDNSIFGLLPEPVE